MRTTSRRVCATAATLIALTLTSPALAWISVMDLGSNNVDLTSAIVVDASGNVAVTGSPNAGPAHVVKYDPAGALLWHVQRPDTVAGGALLALPSGDLVIGTQNRVARLDGADGSVVWEVQWSFPQRGKALYVALDPSGDVIGVGHYGGVVKLDPDDGSEIWSGDNGLGMVTALAIDPTTGDALIGGCGTSNFGCISTAQVHRAARVRGSDGVLLWQSDELDGAVRELAPTPDGDVVTAGETIFRLDGATGATEWSVADVGANAVAIDAAGAAYVGGVHTSGFGFAVDFTVTKLAPDGTTTWATTIAPGVPFGVKGRVHDVVLDGGSVIAAGMLESQPALARLDAASGTVTWKRLITSPRDFRDHLAVVTVAGGDVYAGGSIQSGFPTNSDIAVLRTSAAGDGIPYCGDGTTLGPEECDDGNATPGDGCEPDCSITVCSSGLVISNAELVSSNLYHANPARMRFKGVLPFLVGPGQALEPHVDGAQVRIRQLPYGRQLLLDRSTTPIPPASAGVCLPRRDGWLVSARKSTYRNKSGAIDPPVCTADSAQGLQQLGFTSKPSAGTTAVQLSANGPRGGGGPIEVVIGADTTPGGCARVIFTPEQCQVVGRTSAQTSKVRCRN